MKNYKLINNIVGWAAFFKKLNPVIPVFFAMLAPPMPIRLNATCAGDSRKFFVLVSPDSIPVAVLRNAVRAAPNTLGFATVFAAVSAAASAIGAATCGITGAAFLKLFNTFLPYSENIVNPVGAASPVNGSRIRVSRE